MKKEYYHKIIEEMFDGVFVTNKSRHIIYWNNGAERITGFSSEEMQNKKCSDNNFCFISDNGESACHKGCPLMEVMYGEKNFETVLMLRNRKGERIPVRIKTTHIVDLKGEIGGAIGVFSDNRKLFNAINVIRKLKNIATTDKLVGAKNRNFGEGYIEREVGEHRETEDLGLIYLDLDLFKTINDAHGHEAGDRVLAAASKTIQSCIRQDDTLIRWGGDEFIVVLPEINKDILQFIAKRIKYLIKALMILHNGRQCATTISAGATMLKKNDTVKSFIERADKMLYKSKTEGRDKISFTF